MKKIVSLLLIVLLWVGCKVQQPTASVQDVRRDSVVVKQQVVYRDTTVYVTLPAESHQQVVADTTRSHLETKYAASDAWMEGGMLRHTLVGRDTPLPIYLPKVVKEVVRDTIRATATIQKEVRIVEVNRLTWLQQGQLYGFRLLLLVLLLYVGVRVVRLYLRR